MYVCVCIYSAPKIILQDSAQFILFLENGKN